LHISLRYLKQSAENAVSSPTQGCAHCPQCDVSSYSVHQLNF